MLPRLLIFDDVFGRNVPDGRNTHRENLCGHFVWRDITDDAAARASRSPATKPVAEAVFCRAQTPACAKVGDTVENDLEGALETVRSGWPDAKSGIPWSLVLLDLCFYTGRVTEESHRQTAGMPEARSSDDDPRSYFGLTLLDAIHREFPELPIFILSSKPREEVSLEFSRRGALGFIARDDLRGPELLQEALWQHGLLPDADGLVAGNSLPLLLALREARRAARHGQNVLIRGERGTGKELLARYLHRTVGKKDRPFVPVNSAGFTETMFASELFGIEPKTATNVEGKTGLIEEANDGDLFLDEIADMPAEVQAALLRVLQDRQITRVGGRKGKPVDVRFLSATNVEIEAKELGFREDLLDRLRLGGTVSLPPLRERKGDIPILAEQFAREAEKARPGALRRDIAPEAMECLLAHDWPGNVRELRTCIFDAVNRQPDVEHLVAQHLRIEGQAAAPAAARPAGKRRAQAQPVPVGENEIAGLLARFKTCEFPAKDIGKWAGQLHDLQCEHAWLLARYLQAALDATKRRTPEAPEGQIQIHPAVKLITGDSSLTASKAADIVKRLLKPLESELTGDLAAAYAVAVKLRPHSARRTSREPG